jgi:hypothetical protein
LYRVREKDFRAIGAIYIEPLASRLPLVFQERSVSSRKEKDIECEFFETLSHVIMG